MKRIFLLITLIIFFLPNWVFAQQPAANKEEEEKPFWFTIDLVVLDLAIRDKNGNFVSGLKPQDLKIYEDKIEQKVDYFSQESEPISFGLVIDTSGSMRFKLPLVVNAAKEMLKRSKYGDEVFIINMKDAQNIQLIQPYTHDFEVASNTLNKFVPGGGTALLDGIAEATKYAQQKARNHRKALIIMSDGDDRSSTIEREQLINQLRVTDTQVYLLGFPEGFVAPDGKFIDYTLPKARKLLKRIAEESGGETFFPTSMTEILPILERICVDLRTQYSVGYTPQNPSDGRWHTIEVKMADKKNKYTIRTRPGYFAEKRTEK